MDGEIETAARVVPLGRQGRDCNGEERERDKDAKSGVHGRDIETRVVH
jgi:hypothetical protein